MTPPIKYIATLVPNTIKNGDKVRIKGFLMDGAKEFSINFANESCNHAEFITYHFKWVLDQNIIIENYKVNDVWVEQHEKKCDPLEGNVFDLEFAFQTDYIDVYKVYENTRNRLSTFVPVLSISEITCLQVWGDVRMISDICFKYILEFPPLVRCKL